jgi:nuclear pore complex protein Nup54
MAKLEGMEGTDRERLWPQLVRGFKDLSHRLKVVVLNLRHWCML